MVRAVFLEDPPPTDVGASVGPVWRSSPGRWSNRKGRSGPTLVTTYGLPNGRRFAICHASGHGVRQIARHLDCSPSMISRKLCRDGMARTAGGTGRTDRRRHLKGGEWSMAATYSPGQRGREWGRQTVFPRS
ncbi:helix-turn-helix domain-containing protein [Actinomadura bangladeshensis]|uniref:helix-turn-helix domain-containing protein n=1 Tax=Actinomadura bangladeshensis TaxID=453573 RepID=UPI003B8A7439